jgi:hypothetical protein
VSRTFHKKTSSAREKLQVQLADIANSDKQNFQRSNIANSDFSKRGDAIEKIIKIRDTQRATKLKKAKTGKARQIAELCVKFRVSRSTIYWHLKRGTLPAAERGFHQRGSYPRQRGRDVSKVFKELRMARCALRRADNLACLREHAVRDEEVNLLRATWGEAFEILSRWRPE